MAVVDQTRSPEHLFPDDAPALSIDVEITAEDVVSYAFVHNRAPFLHGITITNRTQSIFERLTIAVELKSAFGTELAEKAFFSIDPPPPGEQRQYKLKSLVLSPGALAGVNERVAGELLVRVSDGSAVREVRHRIDVLAFNEWEHRGGALDGLLPAFVMANDPSITRVLKDAGDFLERHTGSTSLEGYQSGARRARQIAEALYETLRTRGIGYINPPAGDHRFGQKVRTPGLVIDQGLGTCLDLAVTYAACLEGAGLNPVLFLVPGHAFAGFLAEETRLRDAVLRDVNEIDNRVKAGDVVPVETVGLTGSGSLAFDEAVTEARRKITEGLAEGYIPIENRLSGLLDIVRSRSEGIHALPSGRVADGETTGSEPSAEDVPPVPGTGDATEQRSPVPPVPVLSLELPGGETHAGHLEDDRSPLRVRRWKANLLDLSFRNPLLRFTHRKSHLDLVLPGGSIPDLEDLVHDGAELELRPVTALPEMQQALGKTTAFELDETLLTLLLDQEHVVYAAALRRGRARGDVEGEKPPYLLDPDLYPKIFRNLRRQVRSGVEETGSNTLFLALGTLRWSTDEHEDLRSPLYLVPIELVSRANGRRWAIRIEDGGFSTPNHCLAEKLKHEFGLVIPELLSPETDDAGIDIDGAFQAIRRALLDAEVPFRVEETAHIAVFDFAKFLLWKDLEDHWAQFLENPVVRHLVETPTQTFADPALAVDDDINELELFCPMPFDSSQKTAIARAAAGRSFVLEGPPGTGKSQTIANLLANALALGKKVLFVAEKQAALTVVKDRLEHVGLGPFCLDLHAKGSTSREIREQLKVSLEFRTSADPAGWADATARLKSAGSLLRRYPDALHSQNPAGFSAWTARDWSLAMGGGATSAVPDAFLRAGQENFDDVKATVDGILDVAGDAGLRPCHPWRLARDAEFEDLDRGTLDRAVRDLATAIETASLDGPVGRLIANLPTPELLPAVATIAEAINTGAWIHADIVAFVAQPGWERTVRRGSEALDAFVKAAPAKLGPLGPTGLDVDVAELSRLSKEAEASRFMKRRRLRKMVRAELLPHLRDGEELRAGNVGLVAALSELAGKLQATIDQLSDIPGLDVDRLNPLIDDERESIVQRLRTFEAVRLLTGRTAGLDAAMWETLSLPVRMSPEEVGHIDESWRVWSTELRSATDDVDAWIGDRTWIEAVLASLPAWTADAREGRFLGLQRWLDLTSHLGPLVDAGLTTFVDQILGGVYEPEEIGRIFLRSIAIASLDERFAAGGLDRFDARRHNRHVKSFLDADRELRRLMHREIGVRMLAKRPFDPSTLRGEVGELASELVRVRGGASIRGLIRRHPGIVQELTPCFLMSPNSVSRFLEPGTISFDLVVFDEASQIRVADAVGAMGRSKAVVVVGDSRQMPPTSVAIATGGSGEEEDIDDDPDAAIVPVDLESILSEAVESRLPRLWLSWHYRSQDESLIAFSNDHYYDGRLSSFPTPTIGSDDTGLHWRRVNGEFVRHRQRGEASLRTNPVEAHAIVEEIRRRVHASSAIPSIGVVTFNREQQRFILDRLAGLQDDRVSAALESEEEGLFVKNLESVQGDERDTILFSIAFSSYLDGQGMEKFPMRFGPLNQQGGERRLNVAVTRARREVVVFCSFEPEGLDLTRTGSVGVRDLRDYLLMARDGVTVATPMTRELHIAGRHRDDIAGALRGRGLRVKCGVGLSEFKIDIAVGVTEEPDAWRVAVLLDGPDWAERNTVQDRDCLPVNVLRDLLKWPAVERVWMPAWLDERDEIVDRIEQLVLANEPTPESSEPLVARCVPNDPAEESVEVDARSGAPASGGQQTDSNSTRNGVASSGAIRASRFLRYPASPLAGTSEDLDTLGNLTIRRKVEGIIEEVIAVEGPVELNRLARLVCNRFGFERVRAARAEPIIDLVPPARIHRSHVGDFVWPADLDPDAWSEFRAGPGDDRSLNEVAPEELANAMVTIVRAAYSIGVEELLVATRELYGIGRLGRSIRERLDAVLHWAVGKKMLTIEDGRVSPGR